jgi:GntR family transcriptional regulator
METTFLIVQEKLLNILRSQNFPNNKLYSEDELVELLDASRGTVREVLRSLTRQGVITKKHGIGNFVHPRTLNMRMRMDEISNFLHLIEDGGYEAALIKDRDPFEYSLPHEGFAGGLEMYLEKDLQYLCFTRIYLADLQPAIYSQVYIPKHLFLHPPLGDVRYLSLFDFVKKHLGQEIEQAMIWITPEVAKSKIAEKLKILPGNAILVWDELFSNYKDEIIGYSKTHFNPSIIKVCMLRKS